MKTKHIAFLILAVLVQLTLADANGVPDVGQLTAAETTVETLVLAAHSAEPQTLVLGAEDPNTEDPEDGFKLQLVLSSKGASIKTAIFSNGDGKGFDNRDPKNPQPLVLLKSIQYAGGEIQSMANKEFIFTDHKLQMRLDKLHWECFGIETTPEGCQKATFTAVIKNQLTDEPVIKVTKTYALPRSSFTAFCNMTVENLSDTEHNVRFNLTGPVGILREEARSDARKIIGGFKTSDGQVVKSKIDLKKVKNPKKPEHRQLINDNNKLLWASSINKYFAAIAVPVLTEDWQWVAGIYGRFYNPDGDPKSSSGDETISFEIKSSTDTLAAAGQQGSTKNYNMELYLGPKDKKLFDENERYKELGFYLTIDFIGCCCPASIIQPLAFFIMWLMNVLYSGIPNYGIVIIILVFLVRLILHPITKMGQLRMNRFTKLLSSPEIQEIRKKYAKNKVEIQKHISAYQKEKGMSPLEPVMGMLPMMIQMPLWIALWSAVNSSIDLRGAGFLPFWITDLSSPDALFSFPAVSIPIMGKIDSFNLLPMLMGVAFYIQQKMTPQQPSATPEQEQQQKIMKVMMLLMFPLLLYSAPSGVSLYIMASTFAGAIEQYVIKKHIREKEESQTHSLIEVTAKTGGKSKKKKPKPFFRQYS